MRPKSLQKGSNFFYQSIEISLGAYIVLKIVYVDLNEMYFIFYQLHYFPCTGADELAGIKWNLSFMPKRIDGTNDANTLKEYGSIKVELNGNCTNCSNLNSISDPGNLKLVLTNEKQDIASLSYQVSNLERCSGPCVQDCRTKDTFHNYYPWTVI